MDKKDIMNELSKNMHISVYEKIDRLSNFALFISTWKEINIGDHDLDAKWEEFFTLRTEYHNEAMSILNELIGIERNMVSSIQSDEEISQIANTLEIHNDKITEITPHYNDVIVLFQEILRLFDEKAEPIVPPSMAEI